MLVFNPAPGVAPREGVNAVLIAACEKASNERGEEWYVSSTTGGQHSPTSAHQYGKALDISRINGQRIVKVATVRGGMVGLLIAKYIPFHLLREIITPDFAMRFHRQQWTKAMIDEFVRAHRNHVHVSIL